MPNLTTAPTAADQLQLDNLVAALRRGDCRAVVEAMARLAGSGLLDGLATALWVERIVDEAKAAPTRDAQTEAKIVQMVEWVTRVAASDGMIGGSAVKGLADLAWAAAADPGLDRGALLFAVLGVQAARRG